VTALDKSEDHNAKHSVLSFARQKFWSGVIIACVPIGAQVAIALLLSIDSTDFPKADKAFEKPAFWLMQLILLCISVGGNTMVDFNATKLRSGLSQTKIHNMYLCFCVVVISIVVSMLDYKISYWWLSFVLFVGMASLFTAYSIEMELALSSAGLLQE